MCVFFIGESNAQISKKDIKKAEKNIEKLYLSKDYVSVMRLSAQIFNAQLKVKYQTFEYTLNSSYQLHDLNGAMLCMAYYQADGLIKNKKKISKLNIDRLDKLEAINEIIIRRDDELKSGQNSIKVLLGYINEANSFDSIFWQL